VATKAKTGAAKKPVADAKKTATTKAVAPVTKPAVGKPATTKGVALVKKPVATKAAAMPNKTVAANSPVIPKKQASVKAVAAGDKKSVTAKKIVETAATLPVEPKKRKAAAPKKAASAQVAAELMLEASPEVVAELPAEKPSIQGASISFSAVQEPPQHLTLRVDVNRVVAFHYRLREIRPDGSFSPWIEESFGRQPLFYLHGHGNVIAGLEQALAGRKAGDAINITLPPELAYGPRTSNDMMRLPIKHLHGNINPKALLPGSIVTMKTNQGLKNALVMKVGKFNVDVDTNHPYAGRTLHYQIEILGVRPASAEEVAHRHVHGPGGHQH
jgi:FKBP-type peptidyl-prolyl cis-trans isomerase SlyD